ncbi:class I SAM-dependent methyltransferase [Streptosporangiaceae bacterium NEAU-GS5]|nr:class I SAM-dependent methyltransferase [Streptosporangiaceae bacterium NEAU-GS5]
MDTISDRVPAAGQLVHALAEADGRPIHHVIGDTVVRCAVLHAHTQLEIGGPYGLPLDDCDEVFAATAERVWRGRFSSPLDDGSLRRLGPEPYDGWIWNDEHPNDIFGRCFRQLLHHRYGAHPRTPAEEEIALLGRGALLLRELLPDLTPGTLDHAHVIASIPDAGGWKGVASSSQFHLGGTIFLGRSLRSPWWVAEHLFHEAMHQKLYDLRHGHALLTMDLAEDDGAAVHVPWNPARLSGANLWDVHRVLAAFHVYVHLGLLSVVAEQRADELQKVYGPCEGMTGSRKALQRAHYLGEQLRGPCWDKLGPAGKSLVEWLLTALEFVDPAPPPAGAYAHLCLDLYEKEIGQVASALSGAAQPGLRRRLAPLARAEVDGTRRLLTDIGAGQALGNFNQIVAYYPDGGDDQFGASLPDLRRAIAMTLQRVSPDGYRLTESGAFDARLKEMIHGASEDLYAVLAGYPLAVAAAKRRASDLRFRSSCHDDVGRLLSVLAAAVPLFGRILEIGTGTGVGAAWILSGLGERRDVEVITVESDPRLAEAVRAWPWPDHVQVITADAAEAIGGLGEFHLVFADAAPVKYQRLDAVLATLRPGGTLLLDDLDPETATSETQRLEKAALRTELQRAPDLRMADLRIPTGVILAAKVSAPS